MNILVATRVNTNQKIQNEEPPKPNLLFGFKFESLLAIWAVVSILVTALLIPARCCACGYLTPSTLPHTGFAAVFAWIPFSIPYHKHWVTRVVLVLAVVFATASLGRNLADVLWLSPHAGKWTSGSWL